MRLRLFGIKNQNRAFTPCLNGRMYASVFLLSESSITRRQFRVTVFGSFETKCVGSFRTSDVSINSKEVLTEFFKELTVEQRAEIKLVSADGARWIADCVTEFCPNAQRCIDPFHVVSWANDCLDEVRKRVADKSKNETIKGATVQAGKKNNLRNRSNTRF